MKLVFIVLKEDSKNVEQFLWEIVQHVSLSLEILLIWWMVRVFISSIHCSLFNCASSKVGKNRNSWNKKTSKSKSFAHGWIIIFQWTSLFDKILYAQPWEVETIRYQLGLGSKMTSAMATNYRRTPAYNSGVQAGNFLMIKITANLCSSSLTVHLQDKSFSEIIVALGNYCHAPSPLYLR